jgi:hypothetical protein
MEARDPPTHREGVPIKLPFQVVLFYQISLLTLNPDPPALPLSSHLGGEIYLP